MEFSTTSAKDAGSGVPASLTLNLGGVGFYITIVERSVGIQILRFMGFQYVSLGIENICIGYYSS